MAGCPTRLRSLLVQAPKEAMDASIEQVNDGTEE
jgi:hypothetical protein